MKSLATLAVLVAATIGSASASIVTYNTSGSAFSNTTGTVSGGGLILSQTTGTANITLTYLGPSPGPGDATVNSPTNISFGFFDLNYAGTGTVNVPSFTFTVNVNDVTTGFNGIFVGTSAAATVTNSSSTINISYANPLSISLGVDQFTINNPTSIVAPTTLFGQTSIQGQVANNAVPEPGTMLLMGAGLIGVGFTARKKFASRS